MPYPAIYNYTHELTNRHGVALRSMFSDQMSDDAIDAAIDAVHNTTAPVSLVHLRTQGGAISRVATDATAFAHRTQKYFISAIAVWFPDDEEPARHEAWTEDLWAKIRPEGNGVYVNFLQNEEPERIKDAYPEATLQRLREVKSEVRPDEHVPVQPEHCAGVAIGCSAEEGRFAQAGRLFICRTRGADACG